MSIEKQGQNVLATKDLNIEGCSESLRLTIKLPDEEAGTSYSFNGGWVTEIMGGPRLMPDATILASAFSPPFHTIHS